MKQTQTIQGRLLKGNMLIIFVIMVLTTLVFNVLINIFLTKTITDQLSYIVGRTSHIAEKVGPDLVHRNDVPPPDGDTLTVGTPKKEDGSIYFMLDRSLRDSLSVINADYMLLDSDYVLIDTYPNDYFAAYKTHLETMNALLLEGLDMEDIRSEPIFHEFKYDANKYMAVVQAVTIEDVNSYLVVFASLEQIQSIQLGINLILVMISIVMIIIGFFMAVVSAHKIAKPFSMINQHIRNIAHRNFAQEIEVPVADELKEFVQNINYLSEELNKHDASQKMFLQNISHDLRTPLMTVNGYAEAILYDVMEPKSSARVIIQESQKMKKMVEDLLFLSRLDADVDFPMETIDLIERLEYLIKIFTSIDKSETKRILLNTTLVECPFNCNRESIERCFENLIVNALKYAEDRIEIHVKRVDMELHIEVSDDGPGFDEKSRESLFERFKKGDNGNTGLGLSIVKDIIVKHHGTVEAFNNDGATVLIKFRQEIDKKD